MATDALTTADLRRQSAAELEHLGRQSLRDHLVAQAGVARQKHGPITCAKLDSLLQDPACLRHPVRLLYEFGGMAPHQFAQPGRDWRHPAADGRVIYLRPVLRDRPDLVPLAVAYMIPVINFCDIVDDNHCFAYGATLLGCDEAAYYRQLCALADFVGAEVRDPGAPAAPAAHQAPPTAQSPYKSPQPRPLKTEVEKALMQA